MVTEERCRHVLIIIKCVRTGRQVTLLLPNKDAAYCDAATRLCHVERYAARRDTPAGLYEDFAYGCIRDTVAGRTETDGFRKGTILSGPMRPNGPKSRLPARTITPAARFYARPDPNTRA